MYHYETTCYVVVAILYRLVCSHGFMVPSNGGLATQLSGANHLYGLINGLAQPGLITPSRPAPFYPDISAFAVGPDVSYPTLSVPQNIAPSASKPQIFHSVPGQVPGTFISAAPLTEIEAGKFYPHLVREPQGSSDEQLPTVSILVINNNKFDLPGQILSQTGKFPLHVQQPPLIIGGPPVIGPPPFGEYNLCPGSNGFIPGPGVYLNPPNFIQNCNPLPSTGSNYGANIFGSAQPVLHPQNNPAPSRQASNYGTSYASLPVSSGSYTTNNNPKPPKTPALVYSGGMLQAPYASGESTSLSGSNYGMAPPVQYPVSISVQPSQVYDNAGSFTNYGSTGSLPASNIAAAAPAFLTSPYNTPSLPQKPSTLGETFVDPGVYGFANTVFTGNIAPPAPPLYGTAVHSNSYGSAQNAGPVAFNAGTGLSYGSQVDSQTYPQEQTYDLPNESIPNFLDTPNTVIQEGLNAFLSTSKSGGKYGTSGKGYPSSSAGLGTGKPYRDPSGLLSVNYNGYGNYPSYPENRPGLPLPEGFAQEEGQNVDNNLYGLLQSLLRSLGPKYSALPSYTSAQNSFPASFALSQAYLGDLLLNSGRSRDDLYSFIVLLLLNSRRPTFPEPNKMNAPYAPEFSYRSLGSGDPTSDTDRKPSGSIYTGFPTDIEPVGDR